MHFSSAASLRVIDAIVDRACRCDVRGRTEPIGPSLLAGRLEIRLSQRSPHDNDVNDSYYSSTYSIPSSFLDIRDRATELRVPVIGFLWCSFYIFIPPHCSCCVEDLRINPCRLPWAHSRSYRNRNDSKRYLDVEVPAREAVR